MASEKDLRDLIRLIYECSADARQWDRFLAVYAGALDAPCAGLMSHDIRTRFGSVAVNYGLDPFWERRYAEYYGSLNVWFARAILMPWEAGRVGGSEELVNDAALQKTEFYPSPFHRFRQGVADLSSAPRGNVRAADIPRDHLLVRPAYGECKGDDAGCDKGRNRYGSSHRSNHYDCATRLRRSRPALWRRLLVSGQDRMIGLASKVQTA